METKAQKEAAKELKKLLAEMEQQQIADRKKYFKQGHKYIILAVIHPKRGGDDYQTEFTCSRPIKDEEIISMLKKKSSVIDYVQYNINADGTLTDLNIHTNKNN